MIWYILFVFIFICIALLAGYLMLFHTIKFKSSNDTLLNNSPVVSDYGLSRIGNCWLSKNKWGLFEMYIEGTANERGIVNGKLTEKLMYRQENLFVGEIKKRVPGKVYLFLLKLIIIWMIRNIKKHIGNEYCMEIRGIAASASREFRMIGPGYNRIMGYHAAHDIGHALQNSHLVGCTSFALSGEKTSDGKIMHARNFDFYLGDQFSREKIVTFYAPEFGSKFVMITWGGLIGTASGMNIHGLVITVNAAKSKMPFSITTPVTILVRDVLQYACDIHQAIGIISNKKISVSESFLISSGMENKALIVEKTPYKTEIYDTGKNQIICTNHFQSDKLKNDALNIKQKNESASMARYKRVEELLNRIDKVNVKDAVDILRNRSGLNDEPIGRGNEITVNQLLAHHSIVFKPSELKFWISSGPNCLGEFVCYKLDDVFEQAVKFSESYNLVSSEDVIPCDEFLTDGGNDEFETFKLLSKKITECKKNDIVDNSIIQEMIYLNSDYFYSYNIAGDYYKSKKQYSAAVEYYNQALEKIIPNKKERNEIEKNRMACLKKQKGKV